MVLEECSSVRKKTNFQLFSSSLTLPLKNRLCESDKSVIFQVPQYDFSNGYVAAKI
jgi:hypothetical protein